MLRETRLKQIMELLRREGRVENRELCKLFGVSDMTIRRDLDILVDEEDVMRTRGGAVLKRELRRQAAERPMDDHERCKERIARKAIDLIAPGQRIFIDAGTTTRWVGRLMPSDGHNVIATNNLAVALEISDYQNVTVLMIGGELQGSSMSCFGSLTEEQIRRYKLDIAFIGAAAIDDDGFVYTGFTSEAGTKGCIIRSAKKSYLLVESGKFSQDNLMNFCHVRAIEAIITDAGVSPEAVEKMEQAGTKVIIAD